MQWLGKSTRLWPLIETRLDNGYLLFEVKEIICENPSNESKEEFFIGVKKNSYCTFIRGKKYIR